MRLHLEAVREVAWCRVAFAGGAPAGVLVATPPGAGPLPPPPLGARIRAALRQGLAATRRQAALSELLALRRPPDGPWILALLGVAPEHARRGLGTFLVEDWLAQVDAERASAYLETDVPANLHFYGRFGFAAAEAFCALGVRVQALRRPASPGREG